MTITTTATAAASRPISTLRIRILWLTSSRVPPSRCTRIASWRGLQCPIRDSVKPGGTLSLDDFATNASWRYEFGRCLSHELEGLVGPITADLGAASRPGPAVVVAASPRGPDGAARTVLAARGRNRGRRARRRAHRPVVRARSLPAVEHGRPVGPRLGSGERRRFRGGQRRLGARRDPAAYDWSRRDRRQAAAGGRPPWRAGRPGKRGKGEPRDRKSTRLNSSHSQISYAVFCLKKKKKKKYKLHLKKKKQNNNTKSR